MASEALGLVEVRGYLGAVVAADVALKAANVSLLASEVIKGGLTTVQVEGDVGAVRAAVDAAVDAVRDMNCLVSSHVIARVDEQTKRVIKKKAAKKAETKAVEKVVVEPVVVQEVVEEVVTPEVATIEVEATVEEVKSGKSKFSEKYLQGLKVVELRALAYKHPEIGLTKKEIKFGNKQLLLEHLLKL